MRPEVERAVGAVGGGPRLPPADTLRLSLEAVWRRRQPLGDVARRQSKLGTRRFPDDRLFFGAAFAVQP